MIRFVLLVAITASAAVAAEGPDTYRAWFRDGTGLEIFAETSGAPDSARGLLGMSGGRMVRTVVDAGGNGLFGYIIEAQREAELGTFLIRLRPLDSKALELLRLPGVGVTIPSAGVPTLSAAREYRRIAIGEVVALDVPTTAGGRIYDLLRPIDASTSHAGRTSEGPVSPGAELSLKNVRLRVDGEEVRVPARWMVGGAARIDVPGHGAYVIAAYDPKASATQFVPGVSVSGESMMWSIDGDDIEMTSESNALTTGLQATIWVHHDPNSRASEQTATAHLQTADIVESLMQYK